MEVNAAQLFALIGRLYVENQFLREQAETLNRKVKEMEEALASPPKPEGV